MKLVVFVEGTAGDPGALRKAFRQFLERLGIPGSAIQIVAAGDGPAAHRAYVRSVSKYANDRIAFLLIDSEQHKEKGLPNWEFLSQARKLNKPEAAGVDSLGLMVQCMETWFLADREKVIKYFGLPEDGGPLPKHTEPELVSKSEVLSSFDRAARQIRRRRYQKGQDALALLGLVDPNVIAKRCPHAERFFSALRRTSSDETVRER